MARHSAKQMQSILAKEVDFDDLAVKGMAHIELIGNKQAVIDGCIGVLDYNETLVRLNTGKNIIRFTGTDLTISSMSTEQAIVNGNILTMDFS